MKNKITIIHDGFHGDTRFSLMVDERNIYGGAIELSSGQARKLDKAACGVSGCRCGESILRQAGWSADEMGYDGWRLVLSNIENGIIRGYYPQRGR